jgi:platelet-activating factor acetylhydrolase
MRPLESYCIYLAMYAVLHQCANVPFTYWATVALALALLAHLVLEKPRWQLTIMYVQVAHLLYSILLSNDSHWPAGWLFILTSEVLLLVSSAIACLFPIAKFPVLTGKYQTVGVEQRFLSTEPIGTTKENSGVDLRVNTEIGITVWYPSSIAQPTKEGMPFITSGVASGLAKFLTLPGIVFSALPLGRTRAIQNAPIVASKEETAKLPWVVFSHGLGGVATMYSSQCSDLASQGYIVFAPTHNDGSSALAELRASSIPYRRLNQPTTWPNSAEEKEMRATQLSTRVAELQHVIDAVFAAESVEGGAGWRKVSAHSTGLPPYAGRVDLDRLALVGHSFGAATVVGTAAVETRAKAVIGHDVWCQPMTTSPAGSLLATVCEKGVQHAPLLVTLSEEWATGYPSNLPPCTSLVRASKDARLVSMCRTRHSNYSDVPMFSQLVSRKMGAIGPIDFREGMGYINRTMTAFLAEKVQGQADAFEATLKKLGPQTVKVLSI